MRRPEAWRIDIANKRGREESGMETRRARGLQFWPFGDLLGTSKAGLLPQSQSLGWELN